MILEGNKLPAFHSLLASTVDYAGLFPPAKLDLEPALATYRNARRSPESWMLGSFVIARSRLAELEAVVENYLPEAGAGSAWSLSVVLDDTEGDLVRSFDELRSRWQGRMLVASVEVPPKSVAEIAALEARLPEDVVTFFEVPLDESTDRRLEAVAGCGAEAKIRMGGVVAKAFPSVPEVARFLLACKTLGVPFKATAGLHHPLRGPQVIVPGQNATCWMHGFLNLSLAAVLLSVGAIADDELVEVLSESESTAFSFSHGRIVWRDREVTVEQIERSRRSFFSSFGSCSFEDPIQDLAALGLLDRQTRLEPV